MEPMLGWGNIYAFGQKERIGQRKLKKKSFPKMVCAKKIESPVIDFDSNWIIACTVNINTIYSAFPYRANAYWSSDGFGICNVTPDGIESGTLWHEMNIDVTDNPDEVMWAHFIKDERYKSEKIGIYESTHEAIYGTYRATETSLCGVPTKILDSMPRTVRKSSDASWIVQAKSVSWKSSWNTMK